MKKIIFVLLPVIILSLIYIFCKKTDSSEQTIKIGILPIPDVLPFVVAKELRYYEMENIKVELVYFQSAAERDSAFQAKAIDGMLTDWVVCTQLASHGFDVKAAFLTTGKRTKGSRFAIISSPGSTIKKPEDLNGQTIGLASNCIIDFATEELLSKNGISIDKVKKVSIPKISVRLSMLLENRISLAAKDRKSNGSFIEAL